MYGAGANQIWSSKWQLHNTGTGTRSLVSPGNFSGLWWWCWQPWLVLEQFLPLVAPCVFSLLASSSCYKRNNLLDRVRRSDKTFVVNTKWFIPDLRSGNNFWEFRIQILTIFKHIWKLYWTTSMVPYNRYKRRIYGTNYLPFSCSHSNIFKGTGTVRMKLNNRNF